MGFAPSARNNSRRIDSSLGPLATWQPGRSRDVLSGPWLCVPALRRVCPFEDVIGIRDEPDPYWNPSSASWSRFVPLSRSHRCVSPWQRELKTTNGGYTSRILRCRALQVENTGLPPRSCFCHNNSVSIVLVGETLSAPGRLNWEHLSMIVLG